jgi:prepilin-type N-terminal cleavage/methylation domain-containing protein
MAKLGTLHQAGFSLVELLLASAIFGILAVALIGAIIYGRNASSYSGDRLRGAQIADEGLQAVRNIRANGFSNLADGTYGLTQSSNTWALSGTSDTTDIYTRQVVISSPDSSHKLATVNVSWPAGTSTLQSSVVAQFANWTASLTRTWPHAVQAGSANPDGTSPGLKVATQGDYAYIVLSGATQDFLVVNVANPASPTIVKTLSLAGNLTDVVLSGNYAYVTSDSDTSELMIIDVSTPASAHQVGTYSAPGTSTAQALQVVGAYAYIARAANGGNAEFVIVSVANPALPVQVGSYSNNTNMTALYVSGNYAYIGTSGAQLIVLNVSFAFLPTQVDIYSTITSGSVTALAGFGTTLLMGQTSTMSVISTATPQTLSRISTMTTTGSSVVNDITIDSTNTYAFLGTSYASGEFQVVDISNLSAPTVVRTVDISGTSPLDGVAYNSAHDEVIGANSSGSQEVLTFIPN